VIREVLVVDDEPGMRAALEASFRREGWKVQTAAGVNEAVAYFRRSQPGLVITDVRMPDGDGLEVMHRVRELAPKTAVIFLTAFGNVPEAVMAMREGACDYLIKPVPFERVKEAAIRVLSAPAQPPATPTPKGLIGNSPGFKRLLDRAALVARTEADVLVEAESGTGKELLARYIHLTSPRREKPFVAVNCAAFPDNLLESELFGHVRGAFTGATVSKPGKFELANGGTLLLDEIGEMPINLQPKLLRALQEREIDRLGDTRPIRVNVRVIATTNRSLRALAEEGRFRQDLYYRLNVVPLSIPPLRERPEDIETLAGHFIQKHAAAGSSLPRLSAGLVERMQRHSWPGNVRELENFVRRLLALCTDSEPGPEWMDEVPESVRGISNSIQIGMESAGTGISLRDMERVLFVKTLEAAAGNRTRTAEMLGISLRTVRNRIREYGLPARGEA
jgi:DNA-binding NtrC family response regulator